MVVPHSQKGLSIFGWLMSLVVVAFVASTAFKVVPHYLDHMALEKLIKGVETDKAADVRTVSAFKDKIDKGMTVNNMRDLSVNDILDVKIEGDEFIAHLKYERRENIIENLDLVASFDKEYRVRMP